MRNIFFTFLFGLAFNLLNGQTLSPHTVSMDAGDDNSTAFTASGLIGTDAVTYHAHWDMTYLYLGFTGGNANYSSDLYYVAIDVVDGAGSGGSIEGVSFNAAVMDYYVVYENNSMFYGGPVGNGNAFELFENNGSNGWTFLKRTEPANDGTNGQVNFDGSPDEVRFRIAWSDLGVSPGTDQALAMTFWNNNSSGGDLWSSFPTENPTGPVTQTLTHKLKFNSTGSGVNPSTDGVVQALSSSLPVELISFSIKEDSEESVVLEWQSAQEVNSSHYALERAERTTDEFKTIIEIDSKGDSEVIETYTHLDRISPDINYYYRLVHYDLDGTKTISNVLSFKGNSDSDFNLFPMPFKDVLSVQSKSDDLLIAYTIYDAQGRLVSKVVNFSRDHLEINTSNLSPGTYFLTLSSANGKESTRKILKH
jgi:hypothetical protein